MGEALAIRPAAGGGDRGAGGGPIHTVELPEGFFLLDDLERDEPEPEAVA
jgi:hypothetical protein